MFIVIKQRPKKLKFWMRKFLKLQKPTYGKQTKTLSLKKKTPFKKKQKHPLFLK